MQVVELKKNSKNKRYFQVEVYSDSRSKSLITKLQKIITKIKNKFQLNDHEFLINESSGDLSKSKRKGIYVFESKAVDILKNDVIIDKPAVKKIKPIKKATAKVAVKRKRTTKKTAIEE